MNVTKEWWEGQINCTEYKRYTPPFARSSQVPHMESWLFEPGRSAICPLGHSWCFTHDSRAEDEAEKKPSSHFSQTVFSVDVPKEDNNAFGVINM